MTTEMGPLMDQLSQLELDETPDNMRWQDLRDSNKGMRQYPDELGLFVANDAAWILSDTASNEDINKIVDTRLRLAGYVRRMLTACDLMDERINVVARAQVTLVRNVQEFIYPVFDVLASRPINIDMTPPGELPPIDMQNHALLDMYDNGGGGGDMSSASDDKMKTDPGEEEPKKKKKRRGQKRARAQKKKEAVDIAKLGFIDPTKNVQLNSF